MGVATICGPAASGGFRGACPSLACDRSFPSICSRSPEFRADAPVSIRACLRGPPAGGLWRGAHEQRAARGARVRPLGAGAAPIGKSLQQAAEMALFDTGAKELALAAYDSGETADTAVEAYRKARIDGARLGLGPFVRHA